MPELSSQQKEDFCAYYVEMEDVSGAEAARMAFNVSLEKDGVTASDLARKLLRQASVQRRIAEMRAVHDLDPDDPVSIRSAMGQIFKLAYRGEPVIHKETGKPTGERKRDLKVAKDILKDLGKRIHAFSPDDPMSAHAAGDMPTEELFEKMQTVAERNGWVLTHNPTQSPETPSLDAVEPVGRA